MPSLREIRGWRSMLARGQVVLDIQMSEAATDDGVLLIAITHADTVRLELDGVTLADVDRAVFKDWIWARSPRPAAPFSAGPVTLDSNGRDLVLGVDRQGSYLISPELRDQLTRLSVR